MNKSLALKKKLSLFLSLVFLFLIFLYISYFLINGDRGIISYITIKNQQEELNIRLDKLNSRNDLLENRIERLQVNTIDLDYLDEKIRQNTGFINEDEIMIILE